MECRYAKDYPQVLALSNKYILHITQKNEFNRAAYRVVTVDPFLKIDGHLH